MLAALLAKFGLPRLAIAAIGHGGLVFGGQGGSVAVLKELQLGVVGLAILAVIQAVVGRHDQHGGEGHDDQSDAQVGLNAVAVDVEGEQHHQEGGGHDGRGDDAYLLDKASGEQHRDQHGQQAHARHHQLLVGRGGGNGRLILHVGQVAHLVEAIQCGVVHAEDAVEQVQGKTGIQGDQSANGSRGGEGGDPFPDPAQAEDHTQGHHRQGRQEHGGVGHTELQRAGNEDHEACRRQPNDQRTADESAQAEQGGTSRLVGGTYDGTLVDGKEHPLLGLLLGAGLTGLSVFLVLLTREVSGLGIMLHWAGLLRVGLR